MMKCTQIAERVTAGECATKVHAIPAMRENWRAERVVTEA
jgi:hypothetical protein